MSMLVQSSVVSLLTQADQHVCSMRVQSPKVDVEQASGTLSLTHLGK